MKVKPLQDRVLVRRVEKEEKSAGGIIIPDTAKEKSAEGIVEAVGPGKTGDDGKTIPLDVKKGDRVVFSKWAGSEVNFDGEEYLLMKEEEILGVIESGKGSGAKKPAAGKSRAKKTSKKK